VFEVSFIGIFGVIVMLTVVSLISSSQALAAEEGFIVGVKLVKKSDELFSEEPELELLTNEDKCELLKEEKYYGENLREFFFNVRVKGESHLPRVKVLCPAEQVKFVIVGRDYVSYQKTRSYSISQEALPTH
jgi:FAD synthase